MPDATPVWAARTGGPAAEDLVAYGSSTGTDQGLVHADLAGSIAHVAGLHAADLLTTDEATTLVQGLQTLAEQADAGQLELDPTLEDVHMNVEHAIEAAIGPLAGKLHTARSRNDQVALDITLVTREGLASLAEAAHTLATTLAHQAQAHAETPYPVHTHGVPAQPATLGYLLHAHAERITRDLELLLDRFHALDESPLGAGAGAGSTLPIDPGVTADLLGLSPPTNALLATGARDASLEAAQLAARLGQHAQALAVDLLDLAQEGAIELPDAYTTGSSIMPHKVNPDALELARADGATLTALADEIQQVTTGLGLGYHRDLQRAKPPLLDALALAPSVLSVLANVVDGFTVDEATLAAKQALPGVATTDAVEALVQHGIPFREAHQLLAQACKQADAGEATIEEALATAKLPKPAFQAAQAALRADPARRDTLGGPAPATVLAALDDLTTDLDVLAEDVTAVAAHASTPFDLLEAPPTTVLADPEEGSP